jgi:hypothetical protein
MRLRALDPHGPEANPWYAAFRAGSVAGRGRPTVASAESTLTSLRTAASNANVDRLVNSDRLHAQQDDTLVLRAHRGRRLGAVLKSANLAQLTAQFPGVRHLHSWTADGNDAMIATKRRFGFRPVETMHVMEGPVLPA